MSLRVWKLEDKRKESWKICKANEHMGSPGCWVGWMERGGLGLGRRMQWIFSSVDSVQLPPASNHHEPRPGTREGRYTIPDLILYSPPHPAGGEKSRSLPFLSSEGWGRRYAQKDGSGPLSPKPVPTQRLPFPFGSWNAGDATTLQPPLSDPETSPTPRTKDQSSQKALLSSSPRPFDSYLPSLPHHPPAGSFIF